MDRKTVEECTGLSEEEKIAFSEVVARLDQAGVESYLANILVPNKIYYSAHDTFTLPLKIKSEIKVASAFNQNKLLQAIRASQSQKIRYQEFLKLIMEAGVAFYFVFIKGRKAIYFGRNGEQHIENFS